MNYSHFSMFKNLINQKNKFKYLFIRQWLFISTKIINSTMLSILHLPDSVLITIIPFMHVNLELRSSDLGARKRTPPMYRFRAGNSSPRSILRLETIPHSPFRSNFRVLKCHSWSMHGDGVGTIAHQFTQIEFRPDARTFRYCNAVSCV